jgi:ubiquinone/menaquinone biosynthesis C-methylase UbiE
MIKLNLGCGSDIRDGFTNIDFIKSPGVDLIHDLNKKLPFKDNSIDFILASDVLEHFPKAKFKAILQDWIRVLKQGAEIEIRVPNMELICEKLHKQLLPAHILIELIYGGQDSPGNFHYNGFTKPLLIESLTQAGCTEILRIRDSDHNTTVVAKK